MKKIVIIIALSILHYVLHGQHCGPFAGIDENSLSFNEKYRVSRDRSFIKDQNRWEYLQFHFQKNEAVHWDHISNPEAFSWKDLPVFSTFELPVLAHFYRAYVFVSPTGNGFALAGFPFCTVYSPEKEENPTLLLFYNTKGELQKEFKLTALAKKEEITFCGSHQQHPPEYKIWGQCFDFSQAEGCVKYYTFNDKPQLSSDGYFVEFSMGNTQRKILFFLPLLRFVEEREYLEKNVILWLEGKETDTGFEIASTYQEDVSLLLGLLHYPQPTIQNATMNKLEKMFPSAIPSQEKKIQNWSQYLESKK